MDVIRPRDATAESYPFPHVVLDDFFPASVHEEICAAYERVLAEGTSETFVPRLLSRFPGYDAYCWVFDPKVGHPLDIFYGRDLKSYFEGLFGLSLTDEVVVEFHHHRVGSKEDAWHDDFNLGYFTDEARLENGINPWHFQCNYMDAARAPGEPPRLERVRAVAFIYYFGREEYRAGIGGETGLGVADDETGTVSIFRAVEPVPNRLLSFEISLRSHHKFMTNRVAERNSIIGWFHVTAEDSLRRHNVSPHRWSKGDIAGGKRSPEGFPLDEVIYDYPQVSATDSDASHVAASDSSRFDFAIPNPQKELEMPTTKTRTESDGAAALATRKGAARPAVRGGNGNRGAAVAVRATEEPTADADPTSTTATLTTTVSGTIVIGSATEPAKQIKVPVSTKLPPETSGKFAFSYKADDLDKATKIKVGDFIAWAAAQLGLTTKVTDLPASLRDLSVAVLKLEFDTSGKFLIDVEIGTESGGKFDPSWHPIPGLDTFMISDVTLEVKKEAS